MWDMVESVIRKDEGQGLVEYALIITLVAVVLVAGLQALAGSVGGVFPNIIAAL